MARPMPAKIHAPKRAPRSRRGAAPLPLPVTRVEVARTYWVRGLKEPGGAEALASAAGRALGNEVIEQVLEGAVARWRFEEPTAVAVVRREVPLRDLDPDELIELSASL